ncbi:Gaa1-domain-containing protein [Auriculariales sp. MPI-PUGE-AT-0066]|nr:Gaa1-domain-containing protein [Auriculariales sp. MPI-PUGE-AT-0066]
MRHRRGSCVARGVGMAYNASGPAPFQSGPRCGNHRPSQIMSYSLKRYLLERVPERVRRRIGFGADETEDEPHAALLKRTRRQTSYQNLLVKHLVVLRILLLVVGYVWLVALPASPLGRKTYIDENALGPAQVNVRWNWDDVHAADRYLETLNALRAQNTSRAQLAQWVHDEFVQLGLPAAQQRYTFQTSTGVINGTNAYAVFAAPRTSGAEAMVIAASWHTLLDEGAGALNERGIPMVLSLARFLSRYSNWARDIVFIISDNYLDGMHAWLSAYHGTEQPNLVAEPLPLTSGVIWTALAIDYPAHSFSHLGLFFDGLNGRLPNQDLMNSVALIAQYTGGMTTVLYDHIEPSFISTKPHNSLGAKIDHEINVYKNRAKNMLRHFGYEVVGRPSGVHGLLHQFRIDAITVYAVPATGPHGFYSLGRTIESSLRTMSNLLERLHASFFFYLMAGPHHFLQIGHYLPVAIILSIAITVTGLGAWNTAGYTEFDSEEARQYQQHDKHDDKSTRTTPTWIVTAKTFKPRKRKRPVMPILTAMLGAHLAGIAMLQLLRLPLVVQNLKVVFIPACVAYIVLVLTPPRPSPKLASASAAPFNQVLYAFTLLEAGMCISLFAVLNFALATSLAAALAFPLVAISPRSPKLIKLLLVAMAAPAFVNRSFLARTVWDYEVLYAWSLPVACCVYLPVLLQMWASAILCF